MAQSKFDSNKNCGSQFPGESLKIIDFPNSEEQIEVHQKVIDKVLNRKEILDRKIVAVSIVGAFRKGKSFLLNYFLKYLYFMYKSVNTLGQKSHLRKTQHWIGIDDEELTGFSWRKGTLRETTGIVLWSDVFLYDAYDGEKFAIILIDTQGLFDHDTPPAINSKIFSFTTLISSIQIYNLANQVHENELEYLHFATEFAKFSLKDGGTGKPFEHLLFIIRDWVNSSEYENGFNGGLRYMDNNFLKIKENQKENMKEMRKFIKESFDKISCFLMSFPGQSINHDDFNGSSSDLDEEFVNQLKNLLPGILSPENLKAKKINGKDATVYDYLVNLKVYADAFSSNEIPSAQSIYESNVVHFMNQVVKKCIDFYVENISKEFKNVRNDTEFDILHLRIKGETVLMYMKEKKMGSEKNATFFRNKLLVDIDQNCVSYSDKAKLIIQQKVSEDEKRAAKDKLFKMQKEKQELKEKLELEQQKKDEMKIEWQKDTKDVAELSDRLEKIQAESLNNKMFALKLGPVACAVDNPVPTIRSVIESIRDVNNILHDSIPIYAAITNIFRKKN